MKIFLDTSSLFKLYHHEIESEELENVLLKLKITHIYLSEITKVMVRDFNKSKVYFVNDKEYIKKDG